MDAPEVGYDGEVTFAVDGATPRTAHAALAARFDPLAGHVVWTGRVSVEVPPRTGFALSTPFGTARAEAVERDAWGQHPHHRSRPAAVPGRTARRLIVSAGRRSAAC